MKMLALFLHAMLFINENALITIIKTRVVSVVLRQLIV